MPIGAGVILRTTLMLGLALGATTASAQTPSNGGWTDPPARGTAPVPPPAASSPVSPAKEPEPVRRSEIKPDTASRPDASASPAARHAAVPARRRMREARRARPRVVAEAPRVRIATPRRVIRREAMPSRMAAARVYAPRTFAGPPYPYAPLPVGRVAGPVDGERTPEFSDGDDRMRRIAAAQAAGYLVVRARSVRYPDGRMVRSYRPYDDDDGLD